MPPVPESKHIDKANASMRNSTTLPLYRRYEIAQDVGFLEPVQQNIAVVTRNLGAHTLQVLLFRFPYCLVVSQGYFCDEQRVNSNYAIVCLYFYIPRHTAIVVVVVRVT